MNAIPVNDDQMVSASVELAVSGATVRASITVPAGPTRTSELLPTCRTLSAAFVNVAVEQAEERGEHVSCRAGCGACCRQIVPISEPEARGLAALIDQMEEPRRSETRRRFAEGRERLAASGLMRKLTDSSAFSADEVSRYGMEYFRLGIPCPFLEDESCSIYEERPIVCREYLVTSPREECARPTPQTIRTVPLPARVSAALLHVALAPGAERTRWVPLLLAPDWVASHPEEPCERTGPQLVEELFAYLAERRKEPPAEADELPRMAADDTE